MLMDMHVHTSVSSPCSWIDPERMVLHALDLGLDAVCVTEHDEIRGAEVAKKIGEKYGFKVFRGIEIYTDMDDMLVFGFYRDATRWKVPFEELLDMVGTSGIVIPAHPCRISGGLHRHPQADRADFVLRSATALETCNGGCSPESNRVAAELAEQHGLGGIGGSDAHFPFQIGRCVTRFENRVDSDEGLISELRKGRFEAGYGEDFGLEFQRGIG